MLSAILIISLVMTFIFGFEFGHRKGLIWIIALLAIFITDAFVLETLTVVIRSLVWKVFMKVSRMNGRKAVKISN